MPEESSQPRTGFLRREIVPHRLARAARIGQGNPGSVDDGAVGAAGGFRGDVLRAAIADGTALGQEAGRYMEHGGLVPDHVALAAVGNWLEAHEDAFVFDGFPRTVGQAEALHTLLARRHSELTAVLWLELSIKQLRSA